MKGGENTFAFLVENIVVRLPVRSCSIEMLGEVVVSAQPLSLNAREENVLHQPRVTTGEALLIARGIDARLAFALAGRKFEFRPRLFHRFEQTVLARSQANGGGLRAAVGDGQIDVVRVAIHLILDAERTDLIGERFGGGRHGHALLAGHERIVRGDVDHHAHVRVLRVARARGDRRAA